MKPWIGLWLILSLPAWAASKPSAGTPLVGWMIYPYQLTMPEDQYHRLLRSPEVEYVGIQVFARAAYQDDLTRQRVAELAQAGKKIIAQLWFGPSRPFSWERYNFPAIALDRAIREEFFHKVTDPLMDHLGPENLYAVHLMEETGMQFGWDVDVPGWPDRDDDGYENGNAFDNPANFKWDRSISGPNVRTIRVHNDLFRKQTGLDMRYAPIWTPAENESYRTWVQQTMEGGAHAAFGRHVHRKYPGRHVYAFNGGPAMEPQRKVLDGQFFDPYTSTLGIYLSYRGSRKIMRPDQELIGMTWGNREKPVHQRLPQQAASYIGGCNVLSTFGDGEYREAEWFTTVHDSIKPFIGLPVFRCRPRSLVIARNPFGASLRHVSYWITGFAQYDALPEWAEHLVDLDDYDIVFNYAGRHRDLERWVRKGGVLVAVHPGDNFLVAGGWLGAAGPPARTNMAYRPDAWMREHLRLGESYDLTIDRVIEHPVERPDVVHRDGFLYALPYGRGRIVLVSALCAVQAPWTYEPHWEAYRQLLTDVCRGALIWAGQEPVADAHFDDPRLGNDYLRATSDDGRLTVYVLLNDAHGDTKSPTSFVVPGKDRVSGRDDARLCHDHPVIVIRREERK